MFLDYLKFFFYFVLFFILPGFSLLYLFIRPKIRLSVIESFILSAGISVTVINLTMLFLDRLNIALDTGNILKTVFLVIALPLVISTFPSFKSTFLPAKENPDNTKKPDNKTAEKETSQQCPSPAPAPIMASFNLKQKYVLSFLILIALSFFILARFLATDIVPNNTDLGHHMYWARLMESQEKIPAYDTSDVIVGEHIPFAILAKTTEISLLSAMPVIFLLFINSLGFLAFYALLTRIFKSQLAGLVGFFMSAVLYVATDPFGKFISGGVVGNVFGNLFIPLVLLAVFLSLKYKREELMALAMFLFVGIFYIHHLSTFLLLFILLSIFLLDLLLPIFQGKFKNWQPFKESLNQWLKVLLKPLPILIVIGALLALKFIHTPHYIANQAVETVVQAPVKDTHQGVSFMSFISSTGEWRAFLGLTGLLLVFLLYFKRASFRKLKPAFILGWPLILLLLSFFPQFFLVDLPSRRVVNYLVLPLAGLAGFCLILFAKRIKKNLKPGNQLIGFVLLILLFALTLNGLAASFTLFRAENQFQDTVALYHASGYLNEKTSPEDVILKDHANMPADTWIKVFLLRGYNYLLSRTFDYKYEDPTSGRDPCPLEMATAPDAEEGLACVQETGLDYLIMRKNIDNFALNLSDNFSRIYVNNSVVIYKVK